MKIIKLFAVLLLIVSLTGCGLFPRQVESSFEPIAKPELVLPDADQINMRKVEWYIITPDNHEEIFQELDDTDQSIVLLGLTSDGYESLGLNLSDIRAYLQQQQSIIAAYREYYIESEKNIDEANKQIEEMNNLE